MIWVQLYGALSPHYAKYAGEEGRAPLAFGQKRIRVQQILAKLNIPENVVSFVAINGVKRATNTWATDGDKVDIFPVITGG